MMLCQYSLHLCKLKLAMEIFSILLYTLDMKTRVVKLILLLHRYIHEYIGSNTHYHTFTSCFKYFNVENMDDSNSHTRIHPNSNVRQHTFVYTTSIAKNHCTVYLQLVYICRARNKDLKVFRHNVRT